MKLKITNNDRIVAMNDRDSLQFEMDMKRIENGVPIKARVKLGAWLLVEGTDGDGTKFNYILGFPKKSEAPIVGRDELLAKGKEMIDGIKNRFGKGGGKP